MLNGALAVAQKVTAVEGSTIEAIITFMLPFINAEVKLQNRKYNLHIILF